MSIYWQRYKHHEEKKQLLHDLISNRDRYSNISSLPRTYIVWGEYDQIFPVQRGKDLATHLKASISIVDDTAHCPFTEKPREFTKILLGYLNEE